MADGYWTGERACAGRDARVRAQTFFEDDCFNLSLNAMERVVPGPIS